MSETNRRLIETTTGRNRRFEVPEFGVLISETIDGWRVEIQGEWRGLCPSLTHAINLADKYR